MAPPNNPSVARVAFVGNRDTRQWVNTFHVAKPSGSLLAADLGAIASQMRDFWDNYRAALAQSVLLDVIQVRKLDPNNPLALDYTTGLPTGGLRAGQPAPANVSLALSERTGLAGRKYRGRFYAPGLSVSDLTSDDRIASPLVSLMSSILAQYIAQWASTAFVPVIFHRFDNTYTQVLTYVLESILDSQRRRLPARGR